MAGSQGITVHIIPFSHPCLAVTTALDRFGVDHQVVELTSGTHGDELEKIYGPGKRTVPGLVAGEDAIHGTSSIFAWIDQAVDEANLYPDGAEQTIRELEPGLCEDLQSTGRDLAWGALHFRPEALGTYGGGGPLDPAGTDFAIKFLRGAWRYTELTAQRIADRLKALPESLDAVDALCDQGLAGGEEPTALDFQLGSSLHLLVRIGDVRPLIEGRPAERLVTKWFGPGQGEVPSGAFPAGWVPEPVASR